MQYTGKSFFTVHIDCKQSLLKLSRVFFLRGDICHLCEQMSKVEPVPRELRNEYFFVTLFLFLLFLIIFIYFFASRHNAVLYVPSLLYQS